MPSNQTPNYALNQWSRDDRVLMDDFNADNAKIDGALGALSETVAAHTAAIAKMGNCQFYTTTYTGTGLGGEEHPCQVSFPKRALLIFVGGGRTGGFSVFNRNIHFVANNGCAYEYTTWAEDGKSVSWYRNGATDQMNEKDVVYIVVALLVTED